MESFLISLVAMLPFIALVAGLVWFGDERRKRLARLQQEIKDREADRYLRLHRLHADLRGNYPAHLGDLDLDYAILAPGNPEKVNLMISNGITREIAPARPPSLLKNGLPVDDAPAAPTENLAPAPAPTLELQAGPQPAQLPAPALAPEFAPTDQELIELLQLCIQDGYNQKQAVETLGFYKSSGNPEFKKWAAIYNNLKKQRVGS